MRFLNSVTVPKNVKGETLWDFLTLCSKISKQMKRDPLVQSKKKSKKSRIVPKKIRVKNTKGGSLVCFQGSGRRCFCFERGSCVSSMLWTSVVQDVVEQMNKKKWQR